MYWAEKNKNKHYKWGTSAVGKFLKNIFVLNEEMLKFVHTESNLNDDHNKRLVAYDKHCLGQVVSLGSKHSLINLKNASLKGPIVNRDIPS